MEDPGTDGVEDVGDCEYGVDDSLVVEVLSPVWDLEKCFSNYFSACIFSLSFCTNQDVFLDFFRISLGICR